MKRYAAFAFDGFYPRGGWFDYKGNSDTREGAKGIVHPVGQPKPDYWQVVDLRDGKIVLGADVDF